MNKDFEDVIKNFRPVFGNMKHIKALEAIARLRQKEKKQKQLLKSRKAIEKNLKEIEKDEKSILYLIG